MDHTTYLDRYHELTNPVLAQIALLLGKEEYAEATALLTQLRQGHDVLWERFKDAASAQVAP